MAREKGLYTDISETTEEMDKKILKLATTLSESNPEAMTNLKKIMWKGTEEWDNLLSERAKESGKLVLSEFTRKTIERFKQK